MAPASAVSGRQDGAFDDGLGLGDELLQAGAELGDGVGDRAAGRGLVQPETQPAGGRQAPGAKAPTLVTSDLVARMKPGSVLVDISIDQGGCFQDSHPTTHADPTYPVHGSVFYCVANMPGAVPSTSTRALTNVTLPYAAALSGRGDHRTRNARPPADPRAAPGRLRGRPPDPAQEARIILHRSWEKAQEDAEAWFRAARPDPAVARQILGTLTRCSRTREEYDRERDSMTGHGVPGAFLPQWPAGTALRRT